MFLVAEKYFVGQDMSVRDDGRYYTDDSFYADSALITQRRLKGKGSRQYTGQSIGRR